MRPKEKAQTPERVRVKDVMYGGRPSFEGLMGSAHGVPAMTRAFYSNHFLYTTT